MNTTEAVELARRVLKHGEYHPHKQPRDSVWYDRLELARAVLEMAETVPGEWCKRYHVDMDRVVTEKWKLEAELKAAHAAAHAALVAHAAAVRRALGGEVDDG